MSKIIKKQFTNEAIEAFRNTYSVLFNQAQEEAVRISKLNIVLRKLEDDLFDEETLEEMETGQKVVLYDLVMKSNNSAVNNVMKFSQAFANIRNVIGVVDSFDNFKEKIEERDITPKNKTLEHNKDFFEEEDYE